MLKVVRKRRRGGGTARGLSFDRLCVIAGVPRPLPEFRFAVLAGRLWRFDWAWPDQQLAIEVDGGGYTFGRHHRYAGFAEDCVKLNTAVVLGWRVLRCTPQQVQDGTAIDFVKRTLLAR